MKMTNEASVDFKRFVSSYRSADLDEIGYNLKWSKAEGLWLYDESGNKYMDMCAGYGVHLLGRNNPRLRQTIIESLEALPASLVQLDCPPSAGRLAAALIEVAPQPLSRVTFCNSGTESVEIALKYSRKATRREKFIYCKNSFHGLTTGSLSVNGSDEILREGFGELFPSTEIKLNDLDALERTISNRDYAAFILEPVQGRGIDIASFDFLRGARELCTKYGTLMIVDEVLTGLGRTGSMFAIAESGICPDIITVSKALSGGLIPIGACLHSTEVHEKVFSQKSWWIQSTTFKENELAMAIGLAALREIKTNSWVEKAARLGTYIKHKLDQLGTKHSLIREIRGKGLMYGIFLNAEPVDVVFKAIVPLLQKHKIFLQPGAWIKLTPPFTLQEEDVDQFCEALDSVITNW